MQYAPTDPSLKEFILAAVNKDQVQNIIMECDKTTQVMCSWCKQIFCMHFQDFPLIVHTALKTTFISLYIMNGKIADSGVAWCCQYDKNYVMSSSEVRYPARKRLFYKFDDNLTGKQPISFTETNAK